ncbi:MAG: hypothetical protein KDE27_25690 [Planctomycetes bacterium]|nr:hypothetical protein [Planctomycetota bacterium]
MVALPRPLGELTSPPWLTALLAPDASAPVAPPAEIRTRVRDLLRGHGYRPTGRGKPSSEYLAAAAAAGRLGPINPVVDLGNAVSLHSGLPISVVDLGVAMPPLRVDIAPAGTSYVFNASGQVIDIGGLLCLSDVQGPCANAVKDAQRTKTTAATQAVLAVVWGTTEPSGHADATHAWMCESFDRLIGA